MLDKDAAIKYLKTLAWSKEEVQAALRIQSIRRSVRARRAYKALKAAKIKALKTI